MRKQMIRLYKAVRRYIYRPGDSAIYSRAVSSGLFNRTWYQKTYGRRFLSTRAAFEDYLRKSRFAPVNPSPKFDSEIYHRQNMDVYTSVQSPLRHYLARGRFEGRTYVPAVAKWRPKEVISVRRRLTPGAKGQKVAVCLHIYYPEFIERFSEALRHFPIQVDVFLTLADGSLMDQALKVFGALGNIGKVHARGVPNRGRNFGPLLVEYAQELAQYDLFCHLHSKKSLYSGREQTQWSEYLTEFLLRDPNVISRVLNAFAAHEEFGVYYPTSFWMMPSWVNHWTVNRRHADVWLDQFNMSLGEDFIAYPVGGMFWARPAALKELLERKYTYDDFPAEPLPNDGSMLHALERLIGLLAERNGYRQFFYYPPTGQFTTDRSYRFIQYHNTARNAFQQIKNHQVISFDVFDTLVRRRYFAPDYAKLMLGKELAQQGIVSAAREFVTLRNTTEFELRKEGKFKIDISIEAVYQALAKRLGVTEEQGRDMMQREFELDLDMIEGKEEMVDIFNDLHSIGCTLWIITDTYYTREQIGMMLRKAGVTAPFRLLVSNEEQRRKDDTRMWKFVKAELERLGNPSYLHVGDNVVSDAQLPGDFRLQNFHVLNPRDKWHALGFPSVLLGEQALDEGEILKWGPLIYSMGRNPFIGE